MEIILLIKIPLLVVKIAFTILVLGLLIRYTIVKINQDFIQFLVTKLPIFFSAILAILSIWFYEDLVSNINENHHHLDEGLDIVNFCVRGIIALIIVFISIAVSNKLRRTNFKKLFTHIISNDLFYPLLFFSFVFVIEKVIKNGTLILKNTHSFLQGGDIDPIDWRLLIYTLFIISICVYYIRLHITGKVYNFKSNFDKIAIVGLLFFPFFIYEIYHFTYEFFPILITTSIYLTLTNHSENKKERLDETLQWNTYINALKGANEMISLNTDDFSNFAKPRGLRYLTEQLRATQSHSISYLLRKLVNENSRINKTELRDILNPGYKLKNETKEIIKLISDFKFDDETEIKLNKLKIELLKNTNAKFSRFFLVDAKNKDELVSIDLVNLLSQETDLTDDLRIFNSVYLLHRLFDIEIYLIPKIPFANTLIKEENIIKKERERKLKEIDDFHNIYISNVKKWEKAKKLLYYIPFKAQKVYFEYIYLNRNHLSDAIRNLGINKIAKNGTFKYFIAKPKKNNTFIFTPIDEENELIGQFDEIIKRYNTDDYNLERLIEKNKSL